MTRQRFSELLDEATSYVVAVARTMIVEDLPTELRYRILGHRSVPVSPDMKKEEFIDQVYRNGRVHRWIDLAVHACDLEVTHVGAILSDDLVEKEEDCVYNARHMGPFGLKSPRLPSGWTGVEQSGRFSLSR